jgi:hypothetical protein
MGLVRLERYLGIGCLRAVAARHILWA